MRCVYLLCMLNLTSDQVTSYNANHDACRGLGRLAYRMGHDYMALQEECIGLGFQDDALTEVMSGWEAEDTGQA